MAPSENKITDDSISQFLAFSGAVDPAVARQYLEMSGNNLETAVSLFMDHGAGGAAAGGGMGGAAGGMGGGAGGGDGFLGGGLGQPHEVRAPDVSRSMRLVGGNSPVGRGGGGMGMGGDPSAGLIAAMGGPAAREMMRNMMAAENGGGLEGHEALLGSMGSTWAAADDAGAASARGNVRDVDRRRRGSGGGSARTGGGGSRNPRQNNQRNNSDDDDGDVQVVDADRQPMDEDDDYNFSDEEEGSDDGHDLGGTTSSNAVATSQPPSLSTMFAQPTHLMHRGGGFIGAKNFAKDARRWLLVNIQSDDDFACHALNRDVWRDELVENLVREGFILWQAMSSSNEGQTYITRYKVTGYPHLAIIDPRTGSLLWRKESWTQVNPLTAEQFVEIASDFCSRHSFDKLPMAGRHAYANGSMPLGGALIASSSNESSSRPAANPNNKRPIHELTEEQQLQAAIRASMQENADDSDDEDLNDDVGDEKPSATAGAAKKNDNVASTDIITDGKPKPSAFEQEILSMEVGEEPTSSSDVARVQIRMPDGKRLVRKFGGDSQVKIIYAFVAQQPSVNEEVTGGKAFELKFGFPPQDLFASIGDSISSRGLNGEAINVVWE